MSRLGSGRPGETVFIPLARLAITIAVVLGLDSMPGEMAAPMEFLADVETDPNRLPEEFGFDPRGLRDYLVAAGWADQS
jgi:hypothetical protein